MATRAGTNRSAPFMPATGRSRTHVAVNVAQEEAARFGTSHLTQAMRRDLARSVKLPPPSLLDPEDLAAAVRERDEDERARHARRNRDADEEYQAYLDGRGRSRVEPTVDEEVFDDIEEDVHELPPTRNPVRERLERNAAKTRETRATRSNALAELEREADVAARTIRTAAVVPTHERLVARGTRETFVNASREDQLLTDAPDVPVNSGLSARQCTLADVDRLWDWIRADDPAVGIRFVGRALANSQQLHALMTTIAKGEATSASLARSIYVGDAHAGFVVLLPILLTEKMAAVHMYLKPDARGLLPNMLPSLLQMAADVMPDVKLAVMGMPPAIGKLLTAYGFAMQTVFLQE